MSVCKASLKRLRCEAEFFIYKLAYKKKSMTFTSKGLKALHTDMGALKVFVKIRQ